MTVVSEVDTTPIDRIEVYQEPGNIGPVYLCAGTPSTELTLNLNPSDKI